MKDQFEEILVNSVQHRDFVNDKCHSLVARMNDMHDSLGARKEGFRLVDARFETVDRRFDAVDARFDRLEQKRDGFIETQSRANALVERRLSALERPRRRRRS